MKKKALIFTLISLFSLVSAHTEENFGPHTIMDFYMRSPLGMFFIWTFISLITLALIFLIIFLIKKRS